MVYDYEIINSMGRKDRAQVQSLFSTNNNHLWSVR